MDFARNERGFCVGFAWNLIFFSFVREREGYKHHADCTVPQRRHRTTPDKSRVLPSSGGNSSTILSHRHSGDSNISNILHIFLLIL